MIKKIKVQIARYQQFRCWRCGSNCWSKNAVNKCPACMNLCDAPFYLDEINRILKGKEDALYKTN